MNQQHSRKQNALDIRKKAKSAGQKGSYHPERWFHWLKLCAEDLQMAESAFEDAILDRLEPPDRGPDTKWSIIEVLPDPKRSMSRRSWQAYWIGEAIRTLQKDCGRPHWRSASGPTSLAVGGYYGDLVAMVAIALRNFYQRPIDESLLEQVASFGQPTLSSSRFDDFGRTYSTSNDQGLWDQLFKPDSASFLGSPFSILDTTLFNQAYLTWINSGRKIGFSAHFDEVFYHLSAGRDYKALLQFDRAIYVEIDMIFKRKVNIPKFAF